MNKLFVAAIAIAALAGNAAIAADVSLPYKAAPGCTGNWNQGAYIGINGGGVNWTANRTDLDAALGEVATYVQKGWGGVIGGQAGYNWTTCHTFWGIEIDGDWSGTKITTTLLPNAVPPALPVSISSRFDGLVTGRIRSGVVLDNLALFLTGGVAIGHFNTTWSDPNIPVPPAAPPPPFLTSISEWRVGWVAGFGTEWKWTQNVSIRSEVLYVDFVDRTTRVATPAPGFSFTHSDSLWIARLGVNLKFGGPVVASY
jgi:outer membrane immunogenic protein